MLIKVKMLGFDQFRNNNNYPLVLFIAIESRTVKNSQIHNFQYILYVIMLQILINSETYFWETPF